MREGRRGGKRKTRSRDGYRGLPEQRALKFDGVSVAHARRPVKAAKKGTGPVTESEPAPQPEENLLSPKLKPDWSPESTAAFQEAWIKRLIASVQDPLREAIAKGLEETAEDYTKKGAEYEILKIAADLVREKRWG